MEPRQMRIDIRSPEGNTLVALGLATRMMKQAGRGKARPHTRLGSRPLGVSATGVVVSVDANIAGDSELSRSGCT